MMTHPNRPNKRKEKTGGGCAMCKPHKHTWEHRFKKKDRVLRAQVDVG